jgi:hypothetical protein
MADCSTGGSRKKIGGLISCFNQAVFAQLDLQDGSEAIDIWIVQQRKYRRLSRVPDVATDRP